MRKQTVYLIRHAEAEHNIKEREAVEMVKAAGGSEDEQVRARKAVIQDIALTDAPLSLDGISHTQSQSSFLNILHRVFDGHSYTRKLKEENDDLNSTRTGSTTTTSTSNSSTASDYSSSFPIMGSFAAPQLILVSPLRRALMTATELFLHANDKNNKAPPKFVALEALREKRTGFAADERSSVDDLEKQFPHVDFSDLREREANPLITEVPKGEDNAAVRARGRAFVEGPLAHTIHDDSVAIVAHKGWLRELRGTFKSWIEAGQLTVDFDIDHWDQTLYKNAEIRVNDFGWDEDTNQLTSIVSRSVENAIGSVVEEAVKHLIHKSLSSELIHKSLSAPSLLNRSYGNMSKEGLVQFDMDELSDSDDDEDDDEEDSDDDEEEEEDNADEYFFYDQEPADGQGPEQAVPFMAPPLSPSCKLRNFAKDHPSPLHVTKHISFPSSL